MKLAENGPILSWKSEPEADYLTKKHRKSAEYTKI